MARTFSVRYYFTAENEIAANEIVGQFYEFYQSDDFDMGNVTTEGFLVVPDDTITDDIIEADMDFDTILMDAYNDGENSNPLPEGFPLLD